VRYEAARRCTRITAQLTAYATAEAPILRSLPFDVQKEIGRVRQACRGAVPCTSDNDPPRVTKDDEGLISFSVSGKQAVLVDELNFCGGGGNCFDGVNCATGFTHNIAIYVRSGNAWRKALSTFASEPVLLRIENGTQTFKSLVLKVFPGDWGCPPRTNYRDTCAAVVKWDGTKFVHALL
jgi:hypothetical protein